MDSPRLLREAPYRNDPVPSVKLDNQLITPSSCIDYCNNLGYQFAGMEAGYECCKYHLVCFDISRSSR